MKLQDCKREIKERQYLIGMEMEHHSGTHKIKIESFEPHEVGQTGLYYVRCHYYKQDTEGVYGHIVLANKLNDILSQYIPY